MFETVSGEKPLTTEDLWAFLRRLPTLDTGVPDAERVDQLGLLESIKHACAGAQASVAVAFDASQREAQAAAGVPARDRGRGIAAQIALARRESPSRGSRHLGLAKALVHEMPHTMRHLAAGRVSEWRATIVGRETACLSVEDRAAVDAALADDLPTLGDRQVESRAKALAVRFDAASVVKRAAKARADRRVSLRPAPDTMTYLTALLPVEQGVAVYAALQAAVGAARATGDGAAPDQRGAGQVMADTLVERVTGQATAAAVPVEVQLVMPAETLVGEGDEPAAAARRSPGAGCVRPPPPGRLRRRVRRHRWRRSLWPCAGCSPPPTGTSSSRWTPDAASSTASCAGSSPSATRPAAPRGATPRSGTPTTWCPTVPADPPAPPTARGCARPATTPRRRPAGPRPPSIRGPPQPDPARPRTGSAPPPPPGTPTTPPPHRSCPPGAPHPRPGTAPDRSRQPWHDNVITLTWAERYQLRRPARQRLIDGRPAEGRVCRRPCQLSGRNITCRPTLPCRRDSNAPGTVASTSNPRLFQRATAAVLVSTTALNWMPS